ncbi:hypothetical protein X275_10255 [Marinitoga sp. 1197]|uniref:hypothetical protein n=1 Tax=Marinitoga sp. 1197 TaxID=1428449 RepID=UPI00064121C9|nr:hypothetical protein [Marinitoga sp. 1197]KLO21106.1 hypothetical protein X275_10255 [Marinitoga sp. 1197]
MKKYKEISIIILNKNLKVISSIPLEEKSKYNDYDYYMLKIRKKVFYPIPFNTHKFEIINGYGICNRKKSSSFKYENMKFSIFSNESKNNKSVFYSGVENEILVNLRIKKILKSDKYLPVFCVLTKDDIIYNTYYNVISPDFTNPNKNITVVFKQNTKNFLGLYNIDFYIAGYEIFSTEIEFKKVLYTY